MSVPDALRGGLIVSVQAWSGSALDDPFVIAAMARAAQEGGAVAVRVQGEQQLRAVRQRVQVPVVGLIKRNHAGYEPYITATLEDVETVIACDAEIVAFDATDRVRPDGTSLATIVDAIHRRGRTAMADCATAAEMRRALEEGADIVATTLCGYTHDTAGWTLPALDLVASVRRSSQRNDFVVCEGGVHRPEQVRAALDAGADAVVVGTAITNVDWLVREFAGSADYKPLKESG